MRRENSSVAALTMSVAITGAGLVAVPSLSRSVPNVHRAVQLADVDTAESAALAHRRCNRLRTARPRPTQTACRWLALAHAERTPSGAPGQPRAGRQRRRHKAFGPTAHSADPPHPWVHETWPELARATRPRSGPTHLSVNGGQAFSMGWTVDPLPAIRIESIEMSEYTTLDGAYLRVSADVLDAPP